MAKIQHSKQIIQYQQSVDTEPQTFLEEIAESDDNGCIDRLTFRGSKPRIKSLIQDLGSDANFNSEVKSDGTMSITYQGEDAIAACGAKCKLNLLPLTRQEEVRFVVANEGGDQDTVIARRSFKYEGNGSWLQGDRHCKTESGYSVKEIGNGEYEIRGAIYKSKEIIILP